MNLPRWLSVIPMMGLILVLSPLGAQAWRNQPNFQQPRGNAFGWHGQQSQWHQPRGNAIGWHGQRPQWHQPRGHAFGWHGQQSRWHHPGHRQFQHPYMGQPHNPRFPYAGAPYQGHSPAPNFAPRAPGYPHSPFAQGGQPYSQPGYRQHGAPLTSNLTSNLPVAQEQPNVTKTSPLPVAEEQPKVIQSLD